MKHFKPGEKNYKLIQTKDDFFECVELLSKESVIGVDIENNNQVSYNGFICLI